MRELQYTEKFIAFVDVLGWKCHVRDSDAGRGLSLKELCDITDMLGKPTDRDEFEPTICPQARRMRKDLDFCITRHSDSVLISAEISPAGLINLVFHCRKAGMELLSKKGIMCRGYIKHGPICHTAEYQIGVGISDVVDQEKKASPFIEIDTEVIQHVECQPDECIKKVFSGCVETVGGLTIISPCKGFLNFDSGDPEKDLASVNVVRGWLHRMKEHIESHIDPSSESARQKGDQYFRILDAKLAGCDRREKMIKSGMEQFPELRFTPENFPGLF